ncbi:MAG: hypothetical protein IT537_25335 [Hyphomicrobiales bacterium]|nr:hypothetical protein [Hyphomicrobiales bacterium]
MNRLPPSGATPRDRDTAINNLIDGRNNATGTVTLTPGATATTVERANADIRAVVLLAPRSAAAAAAQATTFVSSVTRTGFTITHANAPSTNRTFGYAVLGG